MKKVLLAAMLLCLFIACTKEPAPIVKRTTITDAPVDEKIYDTIPILIPQDSSTFINR
jgi:hypothetical protein